MCFDKCTNHQFIMQIEISGHTETEINELIASGAFSSPDEVVEAAVTSLVESGATVESFVHKLSEAHQSAIAGELEPLDVEDIKQARPRQWYKSSMSSHIEPTDDQDHPLSGRFSRI